jgi:hypothetical protein
MALDQKVWKDAPDGWTPDDAVPVDATPIDAASLGDLERRVYDSAVRDAGAYTDTVVAAIPAPPVTSVNGEVGVVILDANDVGAATQADIEAAVEAIPAAAVGSVNGQTGAVVLDAGDVGAATPADVTAAVAAIPHAPIFIQTADPGAKGYLYVWFKVDDDTTPTQILDIRIGT